MPWYCYQFPAVHFKGTVYHGGFRTVKGKSLPAKVQGTLKNKFRAGGYPQARWAEEQYRKLERVPAADNFQGSLAVTGIEIVDRYVKVRVAPEDADSPDCAVLVDSACADAGRIFVFVDADGRIVDALRIST